LNLQHTSINYVQAITMVHTFLQCRNTKTHHAKRAAANPGPEQIHDE
jgi:hypothetical protein